MELQTWLLQPGISYYHFIAILMHHGCFNDGNWL